MSIVDRVQSGVVNFVDNDLNKLVTLSNTLYSVGRSELVISVRAAGSSNVRLPQTTIKAWIVNENEVNFIRGHFNGSLTVVWQVNEYSAASGIEVTRGIGDADVNSGAITISSDLDGTALPSRPTNKCYTRYNFSTLFSPDGDGGLLSPFLGYVLAALKVSSSTQLTLTPFISNEYFTYSWQRIYVPDATVHHLSGTVPQGANNYDIDLTGLGIVEDESFCQLTFVDNSGDYTFMNSDLKGARLLSNTTCRLFSDASAENPANINYELQIIHRPDNKVHRFFDLFTSSSDESDIVGGAVDQSQCFLQQPVHSGYFSPCEVVTNGYNNGVDEYFTTIDWVSTSKIEFKKYTSGSMSQCIGELVVLDGKTVTTVVLNSPHWTFRR